MPGSPLATPQPLTPADAFELAAGYFKKQLPAIDRYLHLAEVALAKIRDDDQWASNAAFNFHQAAETAYACFLLTQTLYFPRSHNIKFLRSLAEDQDHLLVGAWPRDTRADRRRFELLKRAYVEARYSDNYEISTEDLDWLADGTVRLRDLVEQIGRAGLTSLRETAGL